MPNLITSSSRVTEVSAADPNDALRHFERLLALETDCWDVHDHEEWRCQVCAAGCAWSAGFPRGHVPGQPISRTAESMNETRPRIPPIHYSLSIAAARNATEPTAPQPIWRAWAGK